MYLFASVTSGGAIAVPKDIVDTNDLDVVGKTRDVSGHTRCRNVDNLLTID